MAQQEDMIVDIPPERVKFFGTTGKMLLPSAASVKALLNKIPVNSLITTGDLRQQLTHQFQVEGTCPVTTQKALKVIAHEANQQAPYWRVVNQNGGLISQFPGGVAAQAARLQQEGFTIEASGKVLKVKGFKARLVRLE